ncbi:PREDICTED: metabotropic glutamate receptor 6-like [Priapulus caudatus]|uniref:Metabotropic glutamate receptor 6-like n=1 Tax=Priapulus caudatus TaxID=37621 RepID=A0ABM1F3F2_PRICU|nr:PREDICTED: metabotropic glutamate receptor 6-like [Priapulus caudatus]
MIYVNDNYGRNAAKGFDVAIHDKDICFAQLESVDMHWTASRYDALVTSLARSGARVLVAFLLESQGVELTRAIYRRDLVGRFIVVGAGGFTGSLSEFAGVEAAIAGAFIFAPRTNDVPGFRQWMVDDVGGARSIAASSAWLRRVWETKLACSFADGSCAATPYAPADALVSPSLLHDAVYAFAHAIHAILNTTSCATSGPGSGGTSGGTPGNISGTTSGNTSGNTASGDGDAVWRRLHRCVNGVALLRHIRRLRFDSVSYGPVSFTESGEMHGEYRIYQLVGGDVGGGSSSSGDSSDVGSWSETTRRLSLDVAMLKWPTRDGAVPTSACSPPCAPHHYKVPMHVRCCWQCAECHGDQSLLSASDRCEPCPPLHWADAATGRTCEPIPPDYPAWSEPTSVALALTSATGMATTVAVGCVLVARRRRRIVKASSRELSALIVVGIFLEYAATSLRLARLLDDVIDSAIYAPLFVRALRVYRIFNAGRTSRRPPSCISSASQLTMAAMLIGLQVVASIASTSLHPQEALLVMPSPSVRYVELMCGSGGAAGKIVSLVYNMLLVAACSVLAFKTRHLPDNFNESKLIAFCAMATAVIWVTFVPIYAATTSRSDFVSS